ncbi:hypothetical protein ASG73_01240 [Janibacter sp. Soil728]|uniref:DUF881 domain-containing protein n=1 Tax=Janibacter sp. Soil728 TaxID=1736393 RepID=UPI0006FD5D74|nr:DUF881 domain-containing protein [Janibacter sp. Soil728]KRE39021.1 hypothetical protein ASG73_01240 [Janibacter sp. Soil728]
MPEQDPSRRESGLGRRVRTWLTHRPSRWSSLVPVIALGAGLLFATSGTTARGTDLRSEATGLPDLIRERTIDNERSGQQVERLRGDVDRLTRDVAPGNSRLQKISRQSSASSRDAGLTAVRGPALTVSLDDAQLSAAEVPEGFTVDDVVVHQQDVQGVVNALWRGGAEAMQIMDQRVISTSAVRCVGNTLILQGRVYSPPFTITAIGDRDELQAALDDDPAVDIYRQYVDAVGLGYEVTRKDDVELPAFTGRTKLEHARALRAGQ